MCRPLFFLLPADIKDYTGPRFLFTSSRRRGVNERFYSVDTSEPESRAPAGQARCSAASGGTRPARGFGEDSHWSFGVGTNPAEAQGRTTMDSPSSELGWLEEIIEQLEHDPEECWQALEGLASVERDVRLAVIETLSRHRLRPGVAGCCGSCPRCASRVERRRLRSPSRRPRSPNRIVLALPSQRSLVLKANIPGPRARSASGLEPDLAVAARRGRWLASCVVTPVDGQGRGIGRDLGQSRVATADCRVPVRRATGNRRRHRRGRARVAGCRRSARRAGSTAGD